MTYASVKAAILAHAAAAGAALSDPVYDALDGAPVPRGRSIRVYWAGETEPRKMGAQRDLTGELVAEITRVTLFLPLSANDERQAAAVDAQVYDFKHDLRTRLHADSQLGGTCDDLSMDYATPDFAVLNNTRYVILDIDVTTDYTEYPIAP